MYKVAHYSIGSAGLKLEYTEPYEYSSVYNLATELKELGYKRINTRLFVAKIDGTVYVATYDKVNASGNWRAWNDLRG